MPVVHNAMMLIKPSSVDVTGAGSSATINDSGSVTFSSAVTLSLNDVFSSTYDNYIIDVRLERVGSNVDAVEYRWRSSGIDNSDSNSYNRQYILGDGSSVSGLRNASTVGRFISTAAGTKIGFQGFLYGPALAQPTATRSISNATGLSGVWIIDFACTHNVSASYDGITIIAQAGTLVGLVKVYGLRQ